MRFDACAKSYDAHAIPQRAFAVRVAGFARPLSGEQVLELGAGTGTLTRHLCAKGASVQATDASAAMVELGRAAVPAAHWSILDAFTQPLPSVRLQISSGLLQWAADPVQVLQHWKAALAPGGRMVHAFPCEPCLAEWRALVPESPVVWRTESAWCALFAKAGLTVERHSLWVEQIHFPSALEMLRSMHRSGVTGRARLGPGELRQGLRDYDLRHREADGVAATWAWLAIEAWPSAFR